MGSSWPVTRRGFLGSVAAGAAVSALPAQPSPATAGDGLDNRMRSDHAWERFLAGQDLVWQRMPRAWYEGPFLGNGFLGSMVNGVEGTKNNVTAAGQTITLPAGRYARLHLLGASDNGNTDSSMTVTYADGSTATVPLQLTDWKSGPIFGETEAIRTTQFHSRTGARDVAVAIFHQVIGLDPTREPRSVTLPTLTRPRPHIFAVCLEKPTS